LRPSRQAAAAKPRKSVMTVAVTLVAIEIQSGDQSIGSGL
jgi:hypothetical protein